MIFSAKLRFPRTQTSAGHHRVGFFASTEAVLVETINVGTMIFTIVGVMVSVIGFFVNRTLTRIEADLLSLGQSLKLIEQNLEHKVEDNAARFSRYAIAAEKRLTEIETRCNYEHGTTADRRSGSHVVSWMDRSDAGQGTTK